MTDEVPEEGPPGSFGDAAGEAPDDTDVEGRTGEEEGEGEGDELALARMELAELTADLQRLQAEYLNYKRRVERDRELVRENATYAALTPIIEVLDTIDRASEHGPLEGGFKAVAEQLQRVVSGVGLDQVRRGRRRVRPDHPRGALAHRRGPRGRGDHLQGDRQGRLPDRRPRGPGRAGAGGRPGHRPADPEPDDVRQQKTSSGREVRDG